MKIILIALILLSIVSCKSTSSSESSSGSASSARNDSTTDTTTDVPPVEPVAVSLAMLSDNILYFYTNTWQDQVNANPKSCGLRCFTDGAEKIYYDEFGERMGFEPIYMEPDFIIDDWIVENIEPDQALAMGGLATDYTRVFWQGDEVGDWFLNQFKTDRLSKTNTGEIIALSVNTFYSVSSDLDNINHANKLLIYDFDAINRTALIDGEFVTWQMNYFNQAKQWIKHGETWYSWNGYEFDDNLRENTNGLWSWNTGVKPVDTLQPTVIAVGADQFFTYWIECNTGWLIAHLPAFDQITNVYRLYQGDGERMSGIYKSVSLQPFLEDGVLYFNDNGLRKINLETGIIELVFGNDGEVLGW